MAFARALLAALIVVAVALLPATVGVAAATKAAATTVSDPAAMPCCDQMDRCADAAACALKCFSFVASLPAIHAVPEFHAHARPWTEMPVLHAHILPPPTHPPPA